MEKFICKEDYPVVETEAGKLRGYVWDGIVTFKGIKYADAERFQRPRKPEHWEGVKDAQSYGMVCPLLKQEHPRGELMVPHMYWPMDENCQYLNIWTPSIDDKAKRPVMVWLHGGGFFAGSSIEQLAYEGTNLSKHGDVVVVSLNHRLNILGYLDLKPFGEKYSDSANAGNLDLIAALKWIQDNIRGFGGDPDNVTIFGQSGGGAKVWTLMQMPEADGLFHKGIVESGVAGAFSDVEHDDGRGIGEALLRELGLTENQVEELETISYEKLARAYLRAKTEVDKKGGYTGNYPHKGEDYLGDPLTHGFTEHAKKIPLLVGTVLGEFDFGGPIPNKHKLTRDKVLGMLREKYGEGTDKMIPLFEKAYPDKDLVDLLSLDTIFRTETIEFIKERSKSPESRTYSYQFTYEFPLYDGKIAWHCSEIPFVFHNIDLVPVCNHGEETEKLQEVICGAWVNFARTGVPSIPGVEWTACTSGDEATMILDVNCEVRHNLDHELVLLARKYANPYAFRTGDVQH